MTDMGDNGRALPAPSPDHSDPRTCAVIYLFPRRVRVRPVEETRCPLTPEIAATAAEHIPLRVFRGEGKILSRTIGLLRRYGITALSDLAARTAVDLAELPGVGPQVLRHLDELLTRHGLAFLEPRLTRPDASISLEGER